jgi:hypothetical protein
MYKVVDTLASDQAKQGDDEFLSLCYMQTALLVDGIETLLMTSISHRYTHTYVLALFVCLASKE